MDSLVVFGSLFPILFGLLFVEYGGDLGSLLKTKVITIYEKKHLVIAVVSARDHFEQRQTIRDTWWRNFRNDTDYKDKVDLQFVIGNKACKIHLLDRKDEHSCDKWKVLFPAKTEPLSAIYEDEVTRGNEEVNDEHSNFGVQHLPFKVMHPVILEKLGLHNECIGEKTTVRFLEAYSQKEIASVTLTKANPGNLIDGFKYKSVDALLLPKGFEGVLIAENLSDVGSKLPIPYRKMNVHFNDGKGVIDFINMSTPIEGWYSEARPHNAKLIPIVSFRYQIHDEHALLEHTSGAANRENQWTVAMEKESLELKKESEKYNDITFVPVIDTYRNIPLKLLQFYKKMDSREFNFILKTDDDCFIHIENILKNLQALQHKKKLWWGRFRHNWAIDTFGKWAERDYQGYAYPKFACGSGYVLSKTLISWLSRNADELHVFQGEDVAHGIWLSAVNPDYVDDPMWQCSEECISDMYSSPQLSTEDLKTFWTKTENCGDPCGCD